MEKVSPEEVTGAVTRREVIKTAAGAGLALLLAGRAAADQTAAAEQWVPVGKSDAFVIGQPQRVTVPKGGVLYVTRTDAKTLTAASAKCTHRGCEVAWKADASQLQCPCHGAAFASNGKNIHGTRRSPQEALPALPTLPVRQTEAGMVEVNLAAVAPATIEPTEE